MVIYIDIDETICHSPGAPDYSKSYPIYDRINRFNALYENGHTIVYWTARGSKSSKDWTEITIKQLNLWNVKYHELKFNKPFYDLFIDDKNLNTKDLNNLYQFIK